MKRTNSEGEFRLGISTHAFTDFSADVVPVSQSLQCVRECGGGSTMLLHRTGAGAQPWTATSSPKSTVFDVLASDPEVVKQVCVRSGIENGAVRIIERTERGNIHAFHCAANFVRAIGWRTVIFKAPPVSKPLLPHRAKRETIQACAQFMSSVAAQHPDLRWCADIHYDSSIETVADAEYFCETASSPNVGITLNIGHMTTLHQPGWLLLERLPQRIHVIAWKDHVVGGRNGQYAYSVEAGTGDTPYEMYMTQLRRLQIEPLNLFMLENGSVSERPAVCARSHRYLMELWQNCSTAFPS